MAEKTYKTISGIILTIITLVIGGALYLEKTEDYKSCRAEWIIQDNGQYLCPKNNELQYCYSIESRGSGWYRCWIGVPVKVEVLKEEILLQEKLTFKKFPKLTGQANITKIWKRLDNENVKIEWEIPIFNSRDNVTEKLRGDFEIPKDQIDNVAFIQDTLASEIKREFEDYNKTFIPNPIIEYKDHPLWR